MQDEKMKESLPDAKPDTKEEDKEMSDDWYLPKPVPVEERPYLSPDEMYTIGRRFAERIFTHPDIAPKMRKSGLVVCMQYCDERWGSEKPEVTVDTTQDPIKLYTGKCDVKPNIIMRMHADTAHRFWMQKLNLMIAITKGLIKVKGSIPSVMKMLPIIKPSFTIYKEVLAELGYTELLGYPKD